MNRRSFLFGSAALGLLAGVGPKPNIRLYSDREAVERGLPQIAWGAEDLDTGHIRRGYTPTQAVQKLLADLQAPEDESDEAMQVRSGVRVLRPGRRVQRPVC